jgi:[ribosomal protein S5]-alanine N-acetyltransferase
VTPRVFLRKPRLTDRAAFLEAVKRSRKLHRPWVSPPQTATGFREYLASRQEPAQRAFFVCIKGTGELAGVINLSEIVRGNFQSAYLGYYSLQPHAGKGLMREGLALVLTHAFRKMRLHRVEANVQPGNRASRALVRSLGFQQEGYSLRYLKIGGRWRNHERWALRREDWKAR